ncbi:MAG: GDSL-type esterase/lipase family protein [Chthoniobacteraceae bacterium]
MRGWTFAATAFATITLCLFANPIAAAETPRADISTPCLEKAWFNKHNYLVSLVSEAQRKPPLDIYFLGDSITEFWPALGTDVWKAEFGKMQVLNCGVAGDTTQNILYRITHGEFEHLTPKVIVVLAGINNLGLYPQLTAEGLAHGLQRITETLHARSPASRILLLSIFPSGDAHGPVRQRIIDTNRLLALLNGHNQVTYLDIYQKFLDADGNFPDAITPDGTHLNAKGYQIWADAMRPTLQKLLPPPQP